MGIKKIIGLCLFVGLTVILTSRIEREIVFEEKK